MSSVPCTNCGALLLPGAKFCRMCGQPSLDTASVSEATTRVFEPTVERPAAAATQTWQSQPTGPAYVAPAAASPLRDATTKSLEPAGQRQSKGRLVLSFAALFLAMVFAFAVGMMLRERTTTTTPPVQAPPVLVAPGTGLPPPLPPPRPAGEPPASGPSVPTTDLMYPGAKTIVDMKTGQDAFLQLRTDDRAAKVVDWYINKLKPTQTIRQGTEAVLRTGQMQVVISGRGDETEILIKQGAGK